MDTLAYSKRLRAAHISEEQADAMAEALNEAIESNLATKADIAGLVADVRTGIAGIRTDMLGMETRLRDRADASEGRLRDKMDNLTSTGASSSWSLGPWSPPLQLSPALQRCWAASLTQPLPTSYAAMQNQRTVVCRRCGRVYEVHPWAEPFIYWVCIRRSDRSRCGEMNVEAATARGDATAGRGRKDPSPTTTPPPDPRSCR